jgi:hypothetical protein
MIVVNYSAAIVVSCTPFLVFKESLFSALALVALATDSFSVSHSPIRDHNEAVSKNPPIKTKGRAEELT